MTDEDKNEDKNEEPIQEVQITEVHVNAKGGMERVVMANGDAIMNIRGGGFQQNGATIEATGEKLDVLHLTIIGKFKVVKPKIVQPPSLILGMNGQPFKQ